MIQSYVKGGDGTGEVSLITKTNLNKNTEISF